jgi:hypothetical protein
MKRYKWCTILIAFLLAARPVCGGVVPGRWEKVASLMSGTSIVVTLKTGERAEWIFRGIGPDRMILSDSSGRELAIPKPIVQIIETAGKVRDRLANGALIGAGIGFGSAALGMAGYAAHVTASGPIWGGEATGYYVGAGLVGAGIGALVGTVIDAGSQTPEILYRAK